MKRIIVTFMALTMMIVSALATGGDGNVDAGGGGMGDGTIKHQWIPGDEGVRVTVVSADNHSVVTTPIDFTDKSPSEAIYHFGKNSKLSYTNGRSLSPQQSGYSSYEPVEPIPKIIPTRSSGNNIEAIKKYFCSEYLLKRVSDISGMNYDVLIGGKYKLLIEPIAYYKYEGVMIASTATEAAMYDEQVNGWLRIQMKTLTHTNLPLAMFLEVADLGYPAWSGSTTSLATNANIKSSLGLGVIRFTEEPEEPIVTTYDYEYRVNTEVITSIMVGGGQSDPDNDTTVTFNIEGRNYRVNNVYYPEGDSQLVWVKWTTPDEPQDMVIDVSVQGAGDATNATIKVKIVDLDKNPPPNPVADDRNDDFDYAEVPDRAEKTDADWSIWSPWWQANWVWVGSSENGRWVDRGWWEFDLDRYAATLRADMEIENDSKNPTATTTTFKSGYGITQEANARVSTNQSSAVSRTPNAVSYFPEFGYETYWRLLEPTRSGYRTEFTFQENQYSTYKNPTHFSPIWMPDGPYEVNTWLIDYWTPVGMLSMNLTDDLTVRGSLWDDWHVAPKKP